MRKSEIVLLTLLLAPAPLRAGINTWTSHGPGGGNIQAVVIDPKNSGTVYASAGGGGVFKSTDGGTSWNPASSGLTGYGFRLAIDPQNPSTLYAWNNKLFKSTDSGQNWNLLSAPVGVHGLAIDPQNPDTIYVAAGPGISRSTDGGATWSPASSGLPAQGVGSLAIDPQDPATLYAGVFGRGVFQSTDRGSSWSMPLEQKLIDRAQPGTHTCDEWSWYFARVTGRDAPSPEDISCYAGGDRSTQITADQYIAALETFASRKAQAADFGLIANASAVLADPQNQGSLYALTNMGIFKSTDGAVSWNRASSGIDQRNLANFGVMGIDPTNPDTLYVSTQYQNPGTLYKSMDGAMNWKQVASLFNSVNTVVVDPQDSNAVYAGTYGGLFKSLDAGASWGSRESGLGDSNVFSLIVDPQTPGTLYTGIPSGSLAAAKSTDGGATWTSIAMPGLPGVPFGGSLLAIDPQNPAVIYASGLCCSDRHAALYKSTDSGATWVLTGSQAIGGRLLIDPQNPSTLYAASGSTGGGLIKSTDGGNTWMAINSGLGGTPNSMPSLYPWIIDPQDPNTLYGARYSPFQMFKTSDGGGSWSMISVAWDPALLAIVSLAADPRNSGTLYAGTRELDCGYYDPCPPDYYTKLAATSGSGIFKSTDGGQSWTKLDNAGGVISSIGALAVDPRNSSTLYAATGYPSYPNRVFRSTDGGTSWNELSSGFTACCVSALAVDRQSTVYAATQGAGVLAITFAPE